MCVCVCVCVRVCVFVCLCLFILSFPGDPEKKSPFNIQPWFMTLCAIIAKLQLSWAEIALISQLS